MYNTEAKKLITAYKQVHHTTADEQSLILTQHGKGAKRQALLAACFYTMSMCGALETLKLNETDFGDSSVNC